MSANFTYTRVTLSVYKAMRLIRMHEEPHG